MNARERFMRLMNYETIDRLPVLALEPFEKLGLERWQQEGLPADRSVAEFLGMDEIMRVPVSFHPLPAFASERRQESAEHFVETDSMGAVARRRREAPATYYGYIDHPVKTRADWERYKERFCANSSGRLPEDWGPERIRELNESRQPVGLTLFPFFFRLGFYAMGMERFLTAFHLEPDLIHDILAFWSRFVLEAIRPLLAKVRVDVLIVGEDLAAKNGPLISPRTYAEFWYPHQDAIIELARAQGVPLICQWSAGQFQGLLPGMLEHGFNCTWPLEVVAGMDAPSLRRRHGRGLRLGGNIAKEALIAGPAAIDREIARLMPLIREGGFVPALDDMVPLEVPFAHYRHLIEALRAIRP